MCKKLTTNLISPKDRSALSGLAVYIAILCGSALLCTILVTHEVWPDILIHLAMYGDFPVYLMLIALLLGIPAFNIAKRLLKEKPRSRAITYFCLLLSLYVAACLLPQIALSALFPLYTRFLRGLFVVTVLVFGVYAAIREKIHSKQKDVN